MEENNAKKPLLKEIDILNMVSKLMHKWKFILKTTICFMLIGVVLALSSVKKYTAEIVVAPEAQEASSLSGGIGSFASMMGIDLGAASGGGDAIYPLLYPDIVQSLPFLSSLFSVNVKTADGKVDTTYYHYLAKHKKISWVEYLKATPGRLKLWVENMIMPSEDKMTDPSIFDPYNLSRSQMRKIMALNSSIGVFVDKKTNVLNLSFTERDPLIAATMVDTIMSRLQRTITEYRTKKVIDDCAYIEKMCKAAEVEYLEAQENYAKFVDRNRSVAHERVVVERDRLQADMMMKNTLYTQWAQNLQLAKAKVQEQTPVFFVLKPATIPAIPSSMGKMMQVILYTFLGFVFAVLYVVVKEPVTNTWRKIFPKKVK